MAFRWQRLIHRNVRGAARRKADRGERERWRLAAITSRCESHKKIGITPCDEDRSAASHFHSLSARALLFSFTVLRFSPLFLPLQVSRSRFGSAERAALFVDGPSDVGAQSVITRIFTTSFLRSAADDSRPHLRASRRPERLAQSLTLSRARALTACIRNELARRSRARKMNYRRHSGDSGVH